MQIVPGAKLGPYEILSPLGAGGMGEVFRARDPRLGRDVAIKTLPEVFANDPERLARFEREARLLASLNHPNVAGIHGIEEVDGHRYLILEFVDGETLAARLARGPLPVEEAMEVCRDIAAGVEAAHESGVVHRDLKPGNVIITPSGQVKVLDFGLATSGGGGGTGSDPNLTHSPTITQQATRAGVVLGTAAYMSPEQARGKTVDRRTDIWSFGCVLYECLTGRQLHSGETVSDMIARILEREPDWNALPDNTPARVRELLRRCLRKDARERLRDIGDARIELSEAIAHPDVASAPAAAMPAAAARASRIPWLIAIASVVLAVSMFLLRPASHAPEQRGTTRLAIALPPGLTVSDEVPDAVLSPDGTMLLFLAADSTGTLHLYLRPLNAMTPRMIPGTADAGLPFWAPDNRQFGFFADGNLKRMGINDNDAQVICPAPAPRGGAWGPGDVIVFGPAAAGPLMQVPASGGEPTPATTLDKANGEDGHRFPQFLPDGKHFLYVALPGKESMQATRVGTLDAALGPVILSSSGRATYAAPGYLLFNQKGSIMAQPFDANTLKLSGTPKVVRDLGDASANYSGTPEVSTSLDGTLVQRELAPNDSHLIITDRTGRTLRQLQLPKGAYYEPRFSPDGSRLAVSYARDRESPHIWVVDMARNITTRCGFGGSYDVSPRWTPDGSRVIWGSDRTGGRNLYWMRTDGTGSEELLADVPNLFNDPNSATRDVLVYRSLNGGDTNEDLWILPLTGDKTPKPLLQTRFNEFDASISPDGRWMAYRSDESGRFEVYVTDFPSLERKTRVSANGTIGGLALMTLMKWRKDGHELCYLGPDNRSIMAVPVDGTESFHAGPAKLLMKLPPEALGVDVAPDGQTLVISMPAQEGRRSILNVVMNWQQEMGTSK